MKPLRALRALPALSALPVFVATAQTPVRAYPMGDPLPGREAPAFSLPYARAEGPGPADQPFVLRAELGRVVVLAFCPDPADSAAAHLLRALGGDSASASVFARETVVAVAVPLGVEGTAGAASRLAFPEKLLADSAEAIRRMFGIDRGVVGVYVINPSGRISWREKRFDVYAATSYERLREAVRAAWGTAGTR